MKRDATLDYLRGFAILSIVIGHLYFFSGRANGSIVWNICNTIQIPIFIYVSGLLAQKSFQKYNFFDFIKNRGIRLIIPFLSFFSIWTLLNGLSIEKIVLFATDEFKQGYWFLTVLFELMMIISINRLIATKMRISYFYLDLLSFIFLNIYHFCITEQNTFDKIFSLNLLWHYFPIFLIGVYYDIIKYLFNIKISILYFFIYWGAFYFMYTKNNHTMTALCNMSSLLFLFSLSSHGYRPIEHAIAKTGVYSLQIYLLHILFLGITAPYIPIIENRWVEFVSFFVIASLICIILIYVADTLTKIPMIGLLLFGEKIKKHNSVTY